MSPNTPKKDHEVDIGHILSRSLKQLAPPATHPSIRNIYPEHLAFCHESFGYFASQNWNLDLCEQRDYSHYPEPPVNPFPVPQTTNWHSLPIEIRKIIYREYFSASIYTVHEPAACKCSVWTSQVHKDIFWKDPKTLSSTCHSHQTNLFLASPEIIHEAHPIWLAT